MGGMEGMVQEEAKEGQEAGEEMVALVETVPMAIMHLELVRTAEEEGTAEEEVTAEAPAARPPLAKGSRAGGWCRTRHTPRTL